MSLKRILKLLEDKYPKQGVALLIYSDESGRITNSPTRPYEEGVLFMFSTMKELISFLKETK